MASGERDIPIVFVEFESEEEARRALELARDELKLFRGARMRILAGLKDRPDELGTRENKVRADEVLFGGIQRLMYVVAAAKHYLNLPTENLEVEEKVRQEYLEDAASIGVAPELAMVWISEELKTNKDIQDRVRNGLSRSLDI